MTNPEDKVVDEIDELVDWQLAKGEQSIQLTSSCVYVTWTYEAETNSWVNDD